MGSPNLGAIWDSGRIIERRVMSGRLLHDWEFAPNRCLAVMASCFGIGQSLVAISFFTWCQIF